MKDYNVKIVQGSEVRGEQLRLARARSIYTALIRHCHVENVSCYINSDEDEIIRAKLICLEVPDEPVHDIRSTEEIAIICHKEDISLPEVYALRKDFPTELPHTNAGPYSRPVSLCVSDVTFSDIRPMFNAYDFIKSIRRWFSLNSENKLLSILSLCRFPRKKSMVLRENIYFYTKKLYNEREYNYFL